MLWWRWSVSEPLICLLKVRLVSSVTPSSSNESTVGISALLSLIPSGSFHSLFQVEKSIEAQFPVEKMSCFCLRYGESSSRYRFMLAPVSFLSVLYAYWGEDSVSSAWFSFEKYWHGKDVRRIANLAVYCLPLLFSALLAILFCPWRRCLWSRWQRLLDVLSKAIPIGFTEIDEIQVQATSKTSTFQAIMSIIGLCPEPSSHSVF